MSELAELAQQLNADLRPVIGQVAEALAAEAESRIAPYPLQPTPKQTNRFYKRGTGSVYVRKDGQQTIRRTSETLGRRWSIQPDADGVTLENRASYAAYVHGSEDQTKQHERAGWHTDEGVIDAMNQDGTTEQIGLDAVTKALGLT